MAKFQLSCVKSKRMNVKKKKEKEKDVSVFDVTYAHRAESVFAM